MCSEIVHTRCKKCHAQLDPSTGEFCHKCSQILQTWYNAELKKITDNELAGPLGRRTAWYWEQWRMLDDRFVNKMRALDF